MTPRSLSALLILTQATQSIGFVAPRLASWQPYLQASSKLQLRVAAAPVVQARTPLRPSAVPPPPAGGAPPRGGLALSAGGLLATLALVVRTLDGWNSGMFQAPVISVQLAKELSNLGVSKASVGDRQEHSRPRRIMFAPLEPRRRCSLCVVPSSPWSCGPRAARQSFSSSPSSPIGLSTRVPVSAHERVVPAQPAPASDAPLLPAARRRNPRPTSRVATRPRRPPAASGVPLPPRTTVTPPLRRPPTLLHSVASPPAKHHPRPRHRRRSKWTQETWAVPWRLSRCFSARRRPRQRQGRWRSRNPRS